MHISRHALLSALAGLAAFAPSALASDAQTVTVEAPKATWTSAPGMGVNTSFFLDDIAGGGTCGDLSDPTTACDKTLVHVKGIVGTGSTITFRIEGFLPVSDFDLRVYDSDAEGTEGGYLDGPTSTDAGEQSGLGSTDPRYTSAGDYENKEINISAYADEMTGEVDQYFLVEVPYFIVAQDSYTGVATLDAKPFVAPEPEEGDEA